MEIFYEKGFWAVISLAIGLITIISKLINKNFSKDFEIHSLKIDKKISEEFDSRLGPINSKIELLIQQIESLKNHK